MTSPCFKNHVNYEQIFDNSAQGILIIDKNFKVVMTNRTFRDMFGFKTEEIVGFGCNKYFKNCKCNTDQCHVVRVLNGEDSFETEADWVRADGNYFPTIMTTKQLLDNEGNVIGIIDYFTDMTKLKRAINFIEETEKYQRLILDGISDMVVLFEVADDKLLVLKINKSFINFTGLNEEQVIGKYLHDIIPEEVYSILLEKYWEAINSKIPITFVENLKFYGHLSINAFPVINPDNICTHLIVTFKDNSERKSLEDQQIRIEKLESLGRLAGGIAHDFNNALAVIGGNLSFVKVLLNAPSMDNNKAIEVVKDAEKGIYQAKMLTQKFMTFNKAGDPIRKRSSIVQVLKDTVELACSGSNVRVKYQIDDNLWDVEIDEMQISNAIHHLIINAKQAMPNGGQIHIKASNYIGKPSTKRFTGIKNAGYYVKIVIKDNGTGIDKEIQNKIFDPYFTTKKQGSGLGLAAVHSIIKKHSGSIEVYSEPGQGSAFTIYIPSVDEHPELKYKGDNEMDKKRVLVMDDEPMLRKTICEYLTYFGFDVSGAKDGEEAINFYQDSLGKGNPFSIVIMDLTVPGGMGGKEAICHLIDIDENVKAIVSSGYSNDPVMSDYQNYGFKAVVSKPYCFEELIETIQKVINT